MTPWAEALLYVAARAELVAEVVAPALERGDDVILDRYVDSSVAYQGVGRGLGLDEVLELNLQAVGGLLPDRTFVLEVEPGLSGSRVGASPDRIEREQPGVPRQGRRRATRGSPSSIPSASSCSTGRCPPRPSPPGSTMSFAGPPEQPEAARLLAAALAEGPAHAYLLHGPAGVGKRRAALLFAAGLLGDERRVLERNHPDLYVLEPLGEMIRIDEIRELHRDLHMRPYEAERRVYVIESAQLLNDDAADALLKDLEEPPAYAVIVLVADELGPLPPTIRSRCQLVPFRRLPGPRRARVPRRAGAGARGGGAHRARARRRGQARPGRAAARPRRGRASSRAARRRAGRLRRGGVRAERGGGGAARERPRTRGARRRSAPRRSSRASS